MSWVPGARMRCSRGAYGVRGAPGISPAQLAVVTVLQFTGDLTDRQAADAVRGRLDWKYCLGLGLDDEGFDFSVLSEFRSRLVAGGMEAALLEALLARLGELGLVGAGMPQRTDSTHVLGRIRELNRLELAGETVRAALEALAAAAPDWLAGVIDASWQRVYGQRIADIRLPESKARRAALAVQYGRDGYLLLRAVRGPAAPGWLAGLPAVEALRRIWIQQFCLEPGGAREKVIWRGDEQGLPPGRARIISCYDLEARYADKRGTGWGGYKVHLSETCHQPGPDGRRPGPNLITNTETTPAPVTDAEMTEPVHDTLAARGLPPGEHAADTGYASADLLLAARARGITLLAPLPPDGSWQARSGGYTAAMFTIDWDARQVTCPQGARSSSWTPSRNTNGADGILARFTRATASPARPAPGAPPRSVPAARSACGPARCTRPPPPPAPSRPATPGGADTGSAPGSKAPSPRPPTSPASAAPATSACPKPASSTTPQPPPSTSSGSTPGGPAAPSTAPAPPTCNDST